MREFDVLVLIVQLSLSLFFMSPAKHSLLLEILGFQVFPELINLPIQCVNHLVLSLDDVFELHLFRLGLMDFVCSLLHLQLHLLVLLHQTLGSELLAIVFKLQIPKLVLEILDVLL